MANRIDWKAKDEQQAAERAVLAQLAPAVCALLPGEWSVKPHLNRAEDAPHLPTWYELAGPDGAVLTISGGTFDSNGKVHVHGSFTDRHEGVQFWYVPSDAVNPSINVSASRGAHGVAKEIARRLLPEYVKLLVACNEARALHVKRQARARWAAEEIADFIGSSPSNISREREGLAHNVNVYRSASLAGSLVDVKVGVDYDDEPKAHVRIDHIDVPVEVAKQVLAVLIRHQQLVKEAA